MAIRNGRAHTGGSAPEDELLDALWREGSRLETILVVHSHDSLREALAWTLEHYGYRTVEAGSREEAVELARREQPALVLLDLARGRPAGAEIAADIAGDPSTRHIPILALSSDTASSEALGTWGIREALLMPVEQEELLAAIDRALEPGRRPAYPVLHEGEAWQCTLELGDRLRSEHLTLGFRFPASARIEILPANNELIRGFLRRLAELGIQTEIRVDGSELVLAYEVTIAEALVIGYNEVAPDELFFALSDAFPELGREPEALRRRIARLEGEYRRVQRIAS